LTIRSPLRSRAPKRHWSSDTTRTPGLCVSRSHAASRHAADRPGNSGHGEACRRPLTRKSQFRLHRGRSSGCSTVKKQPRRARSASRPHRRRHSRATIRVSGRCRARSHSRSAGGRRLCSVDHAVQGGAKWTHAALSTAR
jgi:hypothetical protein